MKLEAYKLVVQRARKLWYVTKSLSFCFSQNKCLIMYILSVQKSNGRFRKCSDSAPSWQDWMKCLQTFCSNLRKTTQQPSNKRLRQVRITRAVVCSWRPSEAVGDQVQQTIKKVSPLSCKTTSNDWLNNGNDKIWIDCERGRTLLNEMSRD